ncbi:hypothetical protein J2789_007098 [Variovorax paradoxus]|nr:hypothetical protein [Variovorax paradoxus]
MKAASAVDVAGVQSNQSIFKTFADCMEATARSGRSDAFVERLQSKVEAAFHEAIKQNNNAMERSHYSLKGVVVAMAAVVGIGAYVLYQLPKGTKGED